MRLSNIDNINSLIRFELYHYIDSCEWLKDDMDWENIDIDDFMGEIIEDFVNQEPNASILKYDISRKINRLNFELHTFTDMLYIINKELKDNYGEKFAFTPKNKGAEGFEELIGMYAYVYCKFIYDKNEWDLKDLKEIVIDNDHLTAGLEDEDIVG